MDKLRAMAAFVRIVDAGSLTAAADALDVSQPSMVRLLAALEHAVGVRLINRTTSGASWCSRPWTRPSRAWRRDVPSRAGACGSLPP
jgi:hypothetical protein